MDNLELYNKVREVPANAQRKIEAGRLKGKTDINPMWRIKTLTEQFGVCGIGWKTEIINQWLDAGANGEISAFCQIHLFIKDGEKWSEPIEGIGGSMFVSNEKNGLYTDDECYKKAYTDAISVACKMLGIGADVYWGADTTKYTKNTTTKSKEELLQELGALTDVNKVAQFFKVNVEDLTVAQIEQAIKMKRGRK